MSYMRPEGLAADLQFSGVEYARPHGNEASFGQGAGQFVITVGVGLSEVGAPLLRKQYERIDAVGADHLAAGWPAVRDPTRYTRPYGLAAHFTTTGLLYTRPDGLSADFGPRSLIPTIYPAGYGIAASAIGTPHLANTAAALRPGGINEWAFGRPVVFNWRTYVSVPGFQGPAWGIPYVQGGVKTVVVSGLASLATGAVTVVNTRADQTARPGSIAPPAFPQPLVSPRFIRPTGILGATLGTARVQFPPQPHGWLSSAYGYPTVEYKTKTVHPAGIAGYGEGYPRVADKAQRILHRASTVTSVFGDVALRLKDYRIHNTGFLSQEFSPWAEVRNTRRFVLANGIAAPGVGAGTETRNKTPSIKPQGWDSARIGAGVGAGWRHRSIAPAGMPPPFPAFGTASFWQTPSLAPVGIPAPGVPAPAVQPARRFLQQFGDVMERLGTPTVGFSYRLLALQGIGDGTYGAVRVEHSDRAMGVLGFDHVAYGLPWVSFGRRFLEPVGTAAPTMGPPQVGGTRYLGADGFEATRWGTRIIPEARTVRPLGFGESWGLAVVANRVRFLRPDSIRTYPQPYQHWGTARVWNRRQFVIQYEDQSNGLWPPPWPIWTAIANRNRFVGTMGALASVVPRPTVQNKARPILPAGMAAPATPEFYRAGSVTHWLRRLSLEGMEPPYMSGWGVVANAARPLRPAGHVVTLFGTAQVVNTRRSYKLLGFDAAWAGYPFVARRIRELTFEPRYGIAPPSVPLPKVALHTRYIDVASRGIGHPQVGAATLEIHFNRIQPKWTMVQYWGSPTLRNLTPEVRTRGRATDEFGDALLRLQWRPVSCTGTDTALFGRATIADRRQRISFAGTNYLVVSDKLTVVRTGAPPLSTQYIWVDLNDKFNSHWIDLRFQVPNPILQQQVLYPSSMEPMTAMGRPFVHANSLRVEPGIYELTVGEPMVSLWRRRLTTSGIKPQTEVGVPRLSPHTIWAVVEAPKQAIDNHPTRQLHYVDSMKTGGIGAVLGQANVQNRHRTIYAGAAAGGVSFGTHALTNRKQYLGVNGFQMLRMGWHTIPGDNIIEVEPMSMGSVGPGQPVVSRPPYTGPQYLSPQGFTVKPSDELRVEHFNRTLLARGHDSMALGESWNMDLPYQWQTLHVGAPMPTIPDGFDAAHFGPGTWVSHRVRGLQVEGWDSFACEYDYQQFNKRMRVRLGTPNGGAPRRVSPRGDVHSSVGAPGLRPGTHYIRPDGNADQHRKGAF